MAQRSSIADKVFVSSIEGIIYKPNVFLALSFQRFIVPLFSLISYRIEFSKIQNFLKRSSFNWIIGSSLSLNSFNWLISSKSLYSSSECVGLKWSKLKEFIIIYPVPLFPCLAVLPNPWSSTLWFGGIKVIITCKPPLSSTFSSVLISVPLPAKLVATIISPEVTLSIWTS